jgi:hypothetical protein
MPCNWNSPGRCIRKCRKRNIRDDTLGDAAATRADALGDVGGTAEGDALGNADVRPWAMH